MMRYSAQLLLGFPACAIALASLVYGCSLVVSYPDIETGPGAGASTNTGGTHSGGGGTGGTGAGGNSGGGPIGGGGAGPQDFICTWGLENSHHEEASITNVDDTNQWSHRMLSVAWDNDDHLLTVLTRDGGNCMGVPTCADIRDVDLGAHPPSSGQASFGIAKLFDLVLLDNDDQAILVYQPASGNQTIYGTMLTPASLQPNPFEMTAPMNPTWYVERAAVTVVNGSGNPPVLDFFAIINVNNLSRLEVFGRHDGAGPVTPRVITHDSVTLSDQDGHIQGLHHHNGITYAIVGDAQAPLGSRMYTITDALPDKMMYQELGSTGTFPGASSATQAGLNLTGIIMPPQPGEPFQFLAGRVAYADLATFTLDHLPVASLLDEVAVNDFPAGDSAMMRWMDDVVGLFGGTVGDSRQLAYSLYDAYGNERGANTLEFRNELAGVTRDAVAAATGDSHNSEMFINLGGRVLVAWVEDQHTSAGDHQILYYDTLECSTGR